jgi:hypothetical protein
MEDHGVAALPPLCPASPGAAFASPPSGAAANAFQPRSYEGKPRHLPAKTSALLRSFYEAGVARLEAMPPAELSAFIKACLQVSPINCGWMDYEVAEMLYHAASAIEARRAETAQTGSVHESAVDEVETP